ncbi:MAG: YhbY family RNA-binding protein [Burkholderiales bacterium]
MADLAPAQRKQLKARAHALHPILQIGEKGLTDAVVAEIDRALARHELIKIRAAPLDREARAVALAAICERTGAQPVQHIGKMLVVYRPRPPEEASSPEPPARRARTSGWDERRPARAARPMRRRRSASPSRPPRRGPRT